MVAGVAHNHEVEGSSPPPATLGFALYKRNPARFLTVSYERKGYFGRFAKWSGKRLLTALQKFNSSISRATTGFTDR